MLRKIVEMITQRKEDIDNGLTDFIDKIYSYEISSNYHRSYHALKKITEDFATFPTISEWNKYAKEYNFLTHASMEYILNLKWKKIKKLIEYELQQSKI